MSFNHTNLVMLFGGGPTATVVNTLQVINANNQLLTEQIPVGSTSRSIAGPNVNAHFCLQVFVDSAGGTGSGVTVWYSNLAVPDVTNDAHWTQDTTIGTIATDTTTSKIVLVGNVDAQFIRVKATSVTSAASIRAIIRIEGNTHGIGVDLA
jgi:hypothetical protein